jgi:hypothetical protein
MKTLTCDVCRKKLEEPVANRNYFHLAHRDLCEACKDDLDDLIKPVVRTKDPFNYDWYTKLVQESIEKAIQKGKF